MALTGKQERELRKLHDKAVIGCGTQKPYFVLDRYELEDEANVAYYREAANHILDALDDLAEARRELQDANKHREVLVLERNQLRRERDAAVKLLESFFAAVDNPIGGGYQPLKDLADAFRSDYPHLLERLQKG